MTERLSMDIIADLDDLLEAERAALLSGNLENIGRLLDRKEALIDEMSVLEAIPPGPLHQVTGKLRRNQDLLDHALEGIRSVATRLATLRRVRETLDTYDSNGTKKAIRIAADGSLEKRA
ncbi:MAG: flagellar biosynthesis protein FlgN [Roseobacter sp.]|jgi:flagellar biosynthesis/type III secretory pathway chaperone|nr:flagellar biosynthesis protein FlgN [Roseobacter sp.]